MVADILKTATFSVSLIYNSITHQLPILFKNNFILYFYFKNRIKYICGAYKTIDMRHMLNLIGFIVKKPDTAKARLKG